MALLTGSKVLLSLLLVLLTPRIYIGARPLSIRESYGDGFVAFYARIPVWPWFLLRKGLGISEWGMSVRLRDMGYGAWSRAKENKKEHTSS